MKIHYLFGLLICACMASCYPNEGDPIETTGFRPIYASRDSIDVITVSGPRPTVETGKIYAYKQLLFQNEVNKGIHVISIADPKNPVKMAFYKIPLSTEISIKNDHLYTNNGKDLVVISIAKYMNPVLVKRLPNMFPFVNQEFPPNSTFSYFDCPDPAKGYVIRWEQVRLYQPKCRK